MALHKNCLGGNSSWPTASYNSCPGGIPPGQRPHPTVVRGDPSRTTASYTSFQGGISPGQQIHTRVAREGSLPDNCFIHQLSRRGFLLANCFIQQPSWRYPSWKAAPSNICPGGIPPRQLLHTPVVREESLPDNRYIQELPGRDPSRKAA
ncbi:hypothetical protein PTTG_29258 [Puccinia triticina 1-1 BBBD Race 1]|uniref:Uncharacterized protein n=1 Tax=Puccinia triticina (isolate 1-1 / race 1 (BBBD)) TaxID=630390 RepID=A0A180G5X6_PUCT1|nr:hypothetical protein PTTG_29258 [Puccinia triticina 1-1 BBBD Race 1]